jgi:hypothetical protein
MNLGSTTLVRRFERRNVPEMLTLTRALAVFEQYTLLSPPDLVAAIPSS